MDVSLPSKYRESWSPLVKVNQVISFVSLLATTATLAAPTAVTAFVSKGLKEPPLVLSFFPAMRIEPIVVEGNNYTRRYLFTVNVSQPFIVSRNLLSHFSPTPLAQSHPSQD